MSCQNQIWLLIRNNVLIYCFKVASFIEAFLNDTTFLSSKNVAWQRLVSQIITFLKIFQGFSLFSYQCSLAVLCCISQRQLVYNSTSVIFCQQLFSSFSEIFLRSSTRKPSSLISVSIRCLPSHQRQLCYTIMSRIFCQQFFAFILQYNQKSPITAQKLIIYKCLLHIQILSERISLSNSHDFLRRKNCYSFCNSGKTFI